MKEQSGRVVSASAETTVTNSVWIHGNPIRDASNGAIFGCRWKDDSKFAAVCLEGKEVLIEHDDLERWCDKYLAVRAERRLKAEA